MNAASPEGPGVIDTVGAGEALGPAAVGEGEIVGDGAAVGDGDGVGERDGDGEGDGLGNTGGVGSDGVPPLSGARRKSAPMARPAVRSPASSPKTIDVRGPMARRTVAGRAARPSPAADDRLDPVRAPRPGRSNVPDRRGTTRRRPETDVSDTMRGR
jgi:hypothetical protein